MRRARFLAILTALAVTLAVMGGSARTPALAAARCAAPALHCTETDCPAATIAAQGLELDPKTGRSFFLDYPCDLKPGEKVVFILSIHGAGSIGNWQRHYFPAVELKEKYRLVIATPTAATATPLRMWTEVDDAHLQNITNLVFDRFGAKNIKAFWLAGHSQGGFTSNRIVCSPFFRDKVDGWLSLSGGRIGPVQVAAGFGPPPAPGAAPGGPPPGVRLGAADIPACDFNFIFESGQNEIVSLPDTSPWSVKYGCGLRARRPDVVDTKAGLVYDSGRAATASAAWGRKARPGTAEVFVYPNCKGGRLVADVLRLDKGHTEGLEPAVTEQLVRMMVDAPGEKVAKG